MLHFGFSYIGFIYLLLLFIPNIIWSKNQPKDYEKYVVNENKILLMLERVGEVLVCCFVLIFSDFNIKRISLWSLWLFLSFLLMILYECYWIRYFKSGKTMADFYSAFCGIPLAGATLPVLAFFFLGIYGVNFPLLMAVVILGIGHIGIHRSHYKEITLPKPQTRKSISVCASIFKWIGFIALTVIIISVLAVTDVKNVACLTGSAGTNVGVGRGSYVSLIGSFAEYEIKEKSLLGGESKQEADKLSESKDGQEENKPSESETGQEEIADYAALEERLLELAPQIMAGADVDIEQTDMPYQIEESFFYDMTGDGQQELFLYIESTEAGWWCDPNEGGIYVISQDNNGSCFMLAKNRDFRAGYTELLAADGTELFAKGYSSASSWKGGSRLHLGYREGQIVVDSIERYGFHWDLPVINKVYDYQKGLFQVYAGRNPNEGKTEGYGDYISIAESIIIDEESFEPRLVPFTDYDFELNLYPEVYSDWSPFPEKWWQDGGRYPEEGADGSSGTADWIEDAADDRPDEMLAEAVEQSGLKLERTAYPWTEETKTNVTELLRCPVADYYYLSEEYAVAYMRGEVCFYEKTISEYDGSGRWKKIDISY